MKKVKSYDQKVIILHDNIYLCHYELQTKPCMTSAHVQKWQVHLAVLVVKIKPCLNWFFYFLEFNHS